MLKKLNSADLSSQQEQHILKQFEFSEEKEVGKIPVSYDWSYNEVYF